MAKKKKAAKKAEKPAKAPKAEPLTAETVQRMIDASFVRFDMAHGHLSAEDGEQQLRTLGQRTDED